MQARPSPDVEHLWRAKAKIVLVEHDPGRLIAAEGCAGCFVQVAGGRVQSFGRRGEVHTEVIPAVR